MGGGRGQKTAELGGWMRKNDLTALMIAPPIFATHEPTPLMMFQAPLNRPVMRFFPASNSQCTAGAKNPVILVMSAGVAALFLSQALKIKRTPRPDGPGRCSS